MKKDYLLENIFIALQKMGKLVMMVKYQTVTEVLQIFDMRKNLG